jgi:hypothetical protein
LSSPKASIVVFKLGYHIMPCGRLRNKESAFSIPKSHYLLAQAYSPKHRGCHVLILFKPISIKANLFNFMILINTGILIGQESQGYS